VRGLRHAWPWIIAAALVVTLAACGKKSKLVPPDDTAASYTYPRQYPNPGTDPLDTEKQSKTRDRPAPPHAGDLSPFPTDRTTTTIYRSEPVE
ncbi:MAG: hypothetical protein ACTSW2_01000, partial [Alphaproteobacteria bacterium]